MASIQDLHLPKEHYRFTKNGYAERAHFISRLSVPVVIYVLEGTIKYTIGDEEIILNAGDFAAFGPCDHICDVDENGVKFINVYQLPEKLRK